MSQCVSLVLIVVPFKCMRVITINRELGLRGSNIQNRIRMFRNILRSTANR